MSDDTYAIRSRCESCGNMVVEGQNHTCRVTGIKKIHENPAAPKEPKDD